MMSPHHLHVLHVDSEEEETMRFSLIYLILIGASFKKEKGQCFIVHWEQSFFFYRLNSILEGRLRKGKKTRSHKCCLTLKWRKHVDVSGYLSPYMEARP